jgi:hypothetical protein
VKLARPDVIERNSPMFQQLRARFADAFAEARLQTIRSAIAQPR